MRIGEFAVRNRVSAKLLRHYDEIGLLKPSSTDLETGYRSYEPEQDQLLSWILILKHLDFSLTEIKELLRGPVETPAILRQLVRKRIEITSALNEQLQKKVAIDRLITMIEKEGFQMEKQVDLMNMGQAEVQDLKKNIPDMERFLEAAQQIVTSGADGDEILVFRFDISHFKQVNDDYGYEVGDQVIVACYRIIESGVRAHLNPAAVGRAYGDEFIVCAPAGRAPAERTAQAIIDELKRFDFASVGCPKPMAGYIGGILAPQGTELRRVVDDSIETINQARKLGPNSIAIEPFKP